MILILGGARSGKSRFAIESAKRQCRNVAYIATAPACDKEMRARIAQHRKDRPKTWQTLEAQTGMETVLKKILKGVDGIIIECIGTYAANLMHKGLNDKGIIREIKGVIGELKGLRKTGKRVFIVSNEVGGGVVPDTALGRRFRDIVGSINQMIAEEADEVYLTVAGLPVRIK